MRFVFQARSDHDRFRFFFQKNPNFTEFATIGVLGIYNIKLDWQANMRYVLASKPSGGPVLEAQAPESYSSYNSPVSTIR